MRTVIGGYVITPSAQRQQLDPACDPDLNLIERFVHGFKGGDGVLVLRIDPPPTNGPYELNLYAENRMFLLMLNEIDSNEDAITRTLSCNDYKGEFVSVLGELYPSRAVTRDLDVVCRVFKEFAQTGNVSTDLLS